MAHVRDLRLRDLSALRAGVEEELIDLMRADVAEDAAVLHIVVEPGGPAAKSAAVRARLLVDLVGCDVDGLNHLADRALLDEFARVHRRLHFQPFAVKDPVDPLRFCDGLADRREVFECGDARLVREEVLAVLHRAHADAGAFVRFLRGQHELDGRTRSEPHPGSSRTSSGSAV